MRPWPGWLKIRIPPWIRRRWPCSWRPTNIHNSTSKPISVRSTAWPTKRPYLGGSLEAQVIGLCRYLFHEVGFRGNQKNYYDPRNSYLNEVIDRQTGIPLTLSLITMAVGHRVGLRIDGVGLPGHFIVMARAGATHILFDPFHGGRLLDPFDCERLVQQSAGVALDVTPDLLLPASPGLIVTRILSNLKGCYLRAGDFRRAARVIGRLIQIAPADWTQQRQPGNLPVPKRPSRPRHRSFEPLSGRAAKRAGRGSGSKVAARRTQRSCEMELIRNGRACSSNCGEIQTDSAGPSRKAP